MTAQTFGPARASMSGRKAVDLLCLVLLAFVWVVAAFLVDPIGNFPLNDDWAYGSAVRTLVETGDLRLSGWTATNLIAQVFWGALFCLPFGFSFTALRFSTLVLGLIGVLATYGLLRGARASAGLALFGALVLAFSPIYFALSYSFMSDVPFVAVATTSSWLFLRGLHRESGFEIAAGLLFAGIAILIRQVGLALPIAFAVAYVVRYGLGVKTLIGAVLTVAGGFALQFAYEGGLRSADRLPALFGAQIDTIRTQLHQGSSSVWGDAMTIISCSLVYLGLFLFPFLFVTEQSAHRRRTFVALTGAAVATTAILTVWGRLMPLQGIGRYEDPSLAPTYFWASAAFLGLMGAALLVVGFLRSVMCLLPIQKRRVHKEEPYVLAFALVLVITSFAPLPLLGLGTHGFFDEYLIVLLPPLMLAFVAKSPETASFRLDNIRAIIGAVTLLAISAFSVAATHDYLATNRVRWTALNRLMHDYGVGPEEIDGGFEFNGWYLYDDAYTPEPGKSWYWVASDEFFVSPVMRQGYVKLETYPVNRWLPWGYGNIIVQRRNHSSKETP